MTLALILDPEFESRQVEKDAFKLHLPELSGILPSGKVRIGHRADAIVYRNADAAPRLGLSLDILHLGAIQLHKVDFYI